jgi:DNA-binding transcriptional ArsR family regulator
MAVEKFEKVMKSIGDLFRVLSNTDRIKILALLVKKEMDVNKIYTTLGLSQSRTSQHLKLLKLESLVAERRLGKHVFYRIKDRSLSKVVVAVLQFQMISFASDPDIVNLIQGMLNYWQT